MKKLMLSDEPADFDGPWPKENAVVKKPTADEVMQLVDQWRKRLQVYQDCLRDRNPGDVTKARKALETTESELRAALESLAAPVQPKEGVFTRTPGDGLPKSVIAGDDVRISTTVSMTPVPREPWREPVGWLAQDELLALWATKVPGVDPTQRELSAFALGIEVGVARMEQAQGEPVAQIGWADEFGNLFPMDAWKPAQRTHHDSHKTAWRPVFLHPPAAPQQAEPAISVNVLQASDGSWILQVPEYFPKLSAGWHDLYLHPPADEVQRLRDALDEIESETQDVSIQQIARKALEGK